MSQKHEDDQCFLDSSDPPLRPEEMIEFLQKLKKLFVVIDAVVKSVIVSPELNARRAATEETNATASNVNVNVTVRRCKKHERTTVDPSVPDASVSQCPECKKLQQPTKDPFFDQPD